MRATVSFPILAPDLNDATDEEPVSKIGGLSVAKAKSPTLWHRIGGL